MHILHKVHNYEAKIINDNKSETVLQSCQGSDKQIHASACKMHGAFLSTLSTGMLLYNE